MHIHPNLTRVVRISDGRVGVIRDFTSFPNDDGGEDVEYVVHFPNDSELGYVDRVVGHDYLAVLSDNVKPLPFSPSPNL